jgi:hypothetical protein
MSIAFLFAAGLVVYLKVGVSDRFELPLLIWAASYLYALLAWTIIALCSPFFGAWIVFDDARQESSVQNR